MRRKLGFRLISLLMVVVMIMTSINVVLATENEYDDVKMYYPYNNWAVEIGKKYQLIFLENNTRQCTRYEIVNLLYNILEMEPDKQVNSNFTDLQWLNETEKERIAVMTETGIISGYEDRTFKPFNGVTRAEFAVMLDRSNILKSQVSANLFFKDVQNHWASDSINRVAQAGIVNGKGESLFFPEDGITPQEVLIMLDRLVNSNCITNNILVSSMVNTFKCKQYTEKERYIVENMYFRFDEVQNFLKYNWPFEEYCNTQDNWQELATFEDLQWAIFFTAYKMTYYYEGSQEHNRILEDIRKVLFESQGLENNNQLYGKKSITIKNLITSFWAIRNYQIAGTWSERQYPPVYRYKDTAFTNANEFSQDIRNILSEILYTNLNDDVIYNCNMYLPLEAPVTKFMLNCYMLNWTKEFRVFDGYIHESVKKITGLDTIEFETDPSKVPSNYYMFPYIIKGIPKELYEAEFFNGTVKNYYNGKETFRKYAEFDYELAENVEGFFNVVLNVDYRTIDFDTFFRQIREYSVGMVEEDIREYVEYVRKNEIILKGRGTLIPGSSFLYGFIVFPKVLLEFEVVSAKEKKNLFVADFYNAMVQDTLYMSDKYYLCYHHRATGISDFSGETVRICGYKPDCYPFSDYLNRGRDQYTIW